MTKEETKRYNDALESYSSIIRTGKARREEIVECIKSMEHFEDYEKCQDLVEILNKVSDKIDKPDKQIGQKSR